MNNRITDMTEGKPLRLIMIFMLPLLAGNIFQQFYNMVDSLVVGRFVGKTALASVGACSSVNFLFFALGAGLGSGIGVVAAQYFGGGRYEKLKTTIGNSFIILSVISAIVGLLGFLIAKPLLRYLNTPETVLDGAVTYLRVTSLGLLGVSLYNGVSSILRALGDSKAPLYFLIFCSVMNAILDLFFVVVMHLGVFGVAIATIIAQYCSAVISIVYAFRKISFFDLNKKYFTPDWQIINNSVRIGIPLVMQNALIAVSGIVLQSVTNSFGDSVVAAFTVTGRVETLVHQPYGSIASAVTTFTGQNIGAGKPDRVKTAFRQCAAIITGISLVMGVMMFLWGREIIRFFVKDPDVIEIGYAGLKITGIFFLPLGMIYLPRALINGCGDSNFAMVNGFAEVICRIVFSKLFVYFGLFGFYSVWITTGITWLITGIVCCVRYLQGKWMTAGAIA